MSKLELIKYFEGLGKPQWGEVDCNTVALDLFDVDIPPVKGKYSSEKEAVRFYKNYPLTWDQLLSQYAEPVERNYTQPGDLLVTKHKGYVEIRFWIGGQTISIDMDKEQIIATKGMPLDCEIWRIKNGK